MYKVCLESGLEFAQWSVKRLWSAGKSMLPLMIKEIFHLVNVSMICKYLQII